MQCEHLIIELRKGFFHELGIAFQRQEDYLLFPYRKDNEIALYTLKLLERNINIVRIEERKHSLEDIFLGLTGKAASL